jgi:hypothetical protein
LCLEQFLIGLILLLHEVPLLPCLTWQCTEKHFIISFLFNSP